MLILGLLVGAGKITFGRRRVKKIRIGRVVVERGDLQYYCGDYRGMFYVRCWLDVELRNLQTRRRHEDG